MLMVKGAPRVASVPAPEMTLLPLGQFGRAGLSAAARRQASRAEGGVIMPGAGTEMPECALDELWLWRFLLAGRPFGATGAAVGGPDDGATWLSREEHALARRLPKTQMRHRFMAERVALRWIFGRWFRCSPVDAPVPDATPGNSRYACTSPRGPVCIDMAHTGLWLFVAMAQGPLALTAQASVPGGEGAGFAEVAAPSRVVTATHRSVLAPAADPLATSRALAHRACLERLISVDDPGLSVDAPRPRRAAAANHVPLITHPYATVPYAGRARYLYDISVSSRLSVVAARDTIVHRIRGYGWQN